MDSILDQQQSDQQADQHRQADKSPEKSGKIPFYRVVLSVLQASFGVQSEHNRERDFTSGKFMPYVVAAVLFTILFVITLIVIVNMVLGSTSAGW